MKGNSLPNKLWIKVSSKQIPKKKHLSKNKGRNMPTKNFLKRHLYEKISEEKSLPRKHFKQFLYQNFPHKIIPRKLWRDILQTEKNTYLPKSLFRDICVRKKVWRNISTEKVLEKDPYPKNEETSPPKNLNKSEQKKHCKNLMLLNVISCDFFCKFSWKNGCGDFFSWNCLFLVKIFFDGLFG